MGDQYAPLGDAKKKAQIYGEGDRPFVIPSPTEGSRRSR